MAENDANPVVVESSPAAEANEVEQEIPSAGPERIEWQKTGKITPKAAPAPASEADKPAGSAAASEAAPQEKSPKRDTAETRLQEILADLKTAGLSPSQLKTFKREAQVMPSAESAPAKQPEVKAAPVKSLEAPKEPDIADPKYQGDEGWKSYDADVKKYNREFAEYSAKKAVADYQTQQRQAQELQRVQQQIQAGRDKYQDFDQKAEPVIAALIADIDSPVSKAVGESPLFEHLIYTIGGDEKFLALAKSNPLEAVKRIGVMEALIMEELKGKGQEANRNEKGQFQATPEKKAKTVSDAPPPPADVGGKGTPPADEVESTVEKDDVAGYMAAANRRDLASRKR